MRFVLAVLLASLGGVWVGPTSAQTRADIERCRGIADDSRRLGCYDAIVVAPASRSKYDFVPLIELMNFALSYRGDLVETSGWVVPGADVFVLRVDRIGDDALPVDVERLSRHDREAFVEQCGDGCEATVQGTVSPVNFTTGINADRLIVR